ncbi:PREDICTED: uncharacterized protein LOC107528825 [Miniopterus natalensis]|uniref:uncharacterized protein LOC107528825 n=1 Tax=Miniopterus natalensis TaxID=291302 RepID=UPI0007A6F9F9|nr:PREDICTED: uncharacterized protein LOC107528825 [Miniopterus natalensis]
MKISEAALSFLILAAALGSPAHGSLSHQLQDSGSHSLGFHRPSECCYSYIARKIRCTLMQSYVSTSSGCSRPGIIFITKNNRKVCADPTDAGVQECMVNLTLGSDKKPTILLAERYSSSVKKEETTFDTERLLGQLFVSPQPFIPVRSYRIQLCPRPAPTALPFSKHRGRPVVSPPTCSEVVRVRSAKGSEGATSSKEDVSTQPSPGRMKAALFLLVAVLATTFAFCSQATFNAIPSEILESVNLSHSCCLKYHEKVLPRKLVVGYRKALNCYLPAIILITKRNREICTNPNNKWVQDYIENLNLPLLPPRNLPQVKSV